jgi:hypothetical protein
MDEIISVFVSWQFLLVALAIFLMFGLFNGIREWDGIGHYLWILGGRPNLRWIRKFLKFMEAVKIPLLALTGFGFGWLPNMPRPAPLEGSSTLTLAILYAIAGVFSMFIVKAIKKALEARGVNIDLDIQPKTQIGKKKFS